MCERVLFNEVKVDNTIIYDNQVYGITGIEYIDQEYMKIECIAYIKVKRYQPVTVIQRTQVENSVELPRKVQKINESSSPTTFNDESEDIPDSEIADMIYNSEDFTDAQGDKYLEVNLIKPVETVQCGRKRLPVKGPGYAGDAKANRNLVIYPDEDSESEDLNEKEPETSCIQNDIPSIKKPHSPKTAKTFDEKESKRLGAASEPLLIKCEGVLKGMKFKPTHRLSDLSNPLYPKEIWTLVNCAKEMNTYVFKSDRPTGSTVTIHCNYEELFELYK